MVSSLPNLINNPAEEIYKIKYKNEKNNRIYEMCETKYKDCDYFLEYTSFKNDSIEYKCLCCNEN